MPVLQQNGFAGTIEDFNDRVKAVVDAHTQVFGTKPSPALVVAVARNAQPDQYDRLFAVTSHQHAESIKALGAFQPVDQTAGLVKAMNNVKTRDELDAFFAPANEHLIEDAYDDPAAKKEFVRAYTAAKNRVDARVLDPKTRRETLGFAGVGNPVGPLSDIVGTGALAIEQVSTALLLGPPTLAIAEGKAIGKSVSEKSLRPLGATNKKLAVGIAKGVKRDVQHPSENPGYLALDVFGVASLGAGTAARTAAAGRAFADEGVAGAVKAAARRPVGGVASLTKNGYAEEQLLTENPLLNWAQQRLVNLRNARMAKRAEPVPAAAASIFGTERLQNFLDLALDPIKNNFSSENKLGREARVRRRIDLELQMTVKKDLDMVAGWSQTAASAVQRINERLPNRMQSLTVGEQKAIQALALDDPTPIATWQRFHERMIDLNVGDSAAHRAQLAALKLAAKALDNPRPRFVQALDLVRTVVAETERKKIDELGLRVDTADRRVVGEGEYVRRAGNAGSAAEVADIPKPGELGGPMAAKYRGQHTSPDRESGAPMHDLTGGGTIYPDDVYDPRTQVRYYGHGDRSIDAPTFALINKIRDKPLADVTVYRAVPKDVKAINPGDWVTPTKAYAEGHAASEGDGGWHVIAKKVPAQELFTNGDSIHEFGWHPKAASGVRQSETSHYLPVARKGKPRKGVSEKLELMSPQKGRYGIPEPQVPVSLRHEYTGKALIAGDFRFDATSLASNEYAQTVRAASKLNEWQKLRDAGLDKPPDLRWYTPVRKGSAVDDRLRGIMDRALDSELNADDALHLSSLEAQDLQRYLYPAEFKNGQWHLLPDVDKNDVTWVDVRQLDRYRPPAPAGMKTFFQIANEPFRDVTLLYRFAYALNAVGNAGLGLVHQGVLLPVNMLRAVKKEELYGDKVARALETLSGTSRSQSYAPVGVGQGIAKTLTTPGRIMARAWNVVTDQRFREAALIVELRRQAHVLGLDPDDLGTLLFDEKYASNRNEAIRRGNKAMVEMDNMTWFEREYLRHFVFVYPWVSRSFVWNLRTIVEHPVQVAVLNQIGRQADEEFPDILQRVPDWFKRVGYVPVGFNDDGTPKLVNASSVNTFASLSQLLYPIASGFTNVKYASLADTLGPAAKFVVHGVTGKDDFGNDYPDGAWRGAALDALTSLPQLRPSQRKQNPPLPPIDVSDRETLVHRLNAALHQTVFTPGWLDGYGALITGGLTEKSPTGPDSLLARWYQDASLAERHKLEVDLIQRATKMQGELLGQPVPRPVSTAISLSSQRDLAYKVFAQENGRTPTDKERLVSDIGVLKAKSRISDTDAATLQKKLAKLTDPGDLDRFRAGLLDRYADAKVLRDWDSDVRFVWSFRPAVMKPKLAALKSEGLIPTTVLPKDQATLTAWGRQALAYRREARQRARELEAAQGTSDAPVLEADFRAWTDKHDKPVVIDGKSLPSPVRVEWANTTPQDRAAHVASLAKASWGSLTNFDKELLGRKVPASMSEAWAEVAHAKAQYVEANPGAKIQTDQLLGLAKAIDADPRYHGFLNDYTFSRQPRITRFEASSVYKRMPDQVRTEFDSTVGDDAKKAAAALKTGNYNNGEVRAAWRKYIEEDVMPNLKPDLKTFLAPYGISFLTGLVSR